MAIYYADSDSGNNGNPGTQAEPWLDAAPFNSATIYPGDQFLLKRGTTNLYTTAISMPANGSSGNPIVVGAWGSGSKPIICNCVTLNDTWTDLEDGRFTHAVTQYSVAGLFLENRLPVKKATDANCNDGKWFVASSLITYRPTTGVPGDYDLRFENGMPGITLYYGSQYLTFQDLSVLGCYIWNTGSSVASRHDLSFLNIDFIAIPYIALELTSTGGYESYNILIDGCSFNYCTNNIYLIGQSAGSFDSITISNNTMSNTNSWYGGGEMQASGDIDGMSIQNIKNSLFEKNHIYGGYIKASGITFWLDSAYVGTGNVVRKNFIHDITGDGIILSGPNAAVNRNIEIYDNIVANATGKGIMVDTAQAASMPSAIYNNTVINCDISYYGVFMDYCILKNNISINPVSAHVWMQSGIGNNIIDNNCYYPVSGDCFAYEALSANMTWAEWLIATGQEVNSITADPLLVGGTYQTDTDFKLQSGSPCINAGVDVGLTTDYGGFSIVGVPDIGAWEDSGLAYSRGNYAALPTTDADLETLYTGTDVTKVAADDTDMVAQSATGEYAIHQFKVDATGRSTTTITWTGQTNIACSVSTVYLQMFDYSLVEGEYVGWTTIDSDIESAAGIDFTLSAYIGDLSPYKDTNGMIACRVYQEAK